MVSKTNSTTNPGRVRITLATLTALAMTAVILLLGGTTAQAQSDQGAVPNLRLNSAASGTLTITWDAPNPAPSDYRIVWAKQDLGFLSYKNSNEANRGNEYPGGNATSITLTGLTKGATFKVKARTRYTSGGNNNGTWSGPWTATITTRVNDDPPAAPSSLTAGQVTHDSVTLTWTAPGSGSTVTGYRVLRGADANSLSAITRETGSTGTEYSDNTVAAETTYHYAVLALSQDRDGAQSAALSVTTPAEPQQRDSKDSQKGPPVPNRVTRGVPTVTSIVRQIPTSSPTNANTLTWRVTFSEAVQRVDAADFSVSGTTATLAVSAVTGVTGAYDVTATGGDLASLDATVTLSIVTGQNIQSTTSEALTNITPTSTNDNTYVVDNTAPTLTGVFVISIGSQIELRANEGLDRLNRPPASAFTITANGIALTVSNISATANVNRTLLTVSPVISQGHAVVVTYTDPTDSDDANAIQDTAGNDAASFTTGMNSVPAVTNNSTVADTTAPAFASAAADGTSLVITFTENLDAAASLANSAFTVKKTSGGTETTVTLSTATAPVISGKTVTLTLATALVSTDTAVKVSYTKPTTGTNNKLVDAAANETATFTDQTVTNNTPVPDTTPPTLSSATVASAGDQITLTFNESLDGANPPLRSAFRVTADGAVIPIGSADTDFLVGSSGLPAVVFLRNLSPLIRAGQAVVVTYTDPTSGNDTAALQDAAGNDTAAFTTGRNGVPAFSNSSGVAAVAPGAPTSLSATGGSTTSINLSWTAPADNGGRVISGYKVEVSSDSGTTWTVLEATTGTTATTYEHTGLTAGSTRHYRVSAINTIGTGAASNTDSATTLTRANTAPTSSNGTATATEDTVFTFNASNFAFSDGDTGDTLMNVKITELPATGKGTLKLDNTAITSSALPKTVTKADLDADKLKYSPPANANGSRYASFKFKVNDGSTDSASAYTMTINVTRVNDEATGRPSVMGGNEVGNTLTASTSDIIDPDGLPNSFTYQWKRFAANATTFEANIGTNSSTYILTSSEEGKKVKVEVSFTDDGGTREGPLVSSAFPSSGTVTVPTSDSLNVGGLGVYWHGNHDNGGNMLRMDSCTGVKVFRVIWDGPDGNRRADQWAAEITARGGSRAVRQNFRETPGNPGYFELDGRMLLTGPDSISIRVRGRFGATWGTWSPRAGLYCFA